MRAKGIRLEQVVLAMMLLAALLWNLANASEIRQLRVEAGATGTRAEIQLDRHGDFKVIELANPDRLVVDFADSSLARSLGMVTPTGAVKATTSWALRRLPIGSCLPASWERLWFWQCLQEKLQPWVKTMALS